MKTCGHPECQKPLRSDNSSGVCAPHGSWLGIMLRAAQARWCEHDGCDRRVDGDNVTGYCRTHVNLSARQDRRCFYEGCETRLRHDNTTGSCARHLPKTEAWKANSALYYRENADTMKANARASYQRRKKAGGVLRGVRSHDAMMRGKHKRRALEAELFVEHVDLAEVYRIDAGVCHLCSKPAGPTHGPDWHLDHVIPISMFGPHCYDNVAVAHPICNHDKNRHGTTPDPERLRRAVAAFRNFHGV